MFLTACSDRRRVNLPDEHFSPPPSPSANPCCNKHYLVKDLDAGHLVLGTGYLPYIPGTEHWVLGIVGIEYWVDTRY